ncbi:superoxide dismutase family protein [Parerythrobacter jejuensis]|uniref:Superoxide dismutase family protein n=1 Tax=Parerythrobacter jejuensis TaxID=795812 RepID=A0A845ATA1_9SPHN|nr:superoxide dismutase family protein [Parerythrobacter jejuensis]MXP30770.1 superoxide dismutase family protein [Parerythrobacter jejuensis]MXP33530.1 superoxide dismutase family protein [Parerythrobacter jejuensis]
MKLFAVAAMAALPLLASCSTASQLPTERLGSATVSLSNGVPAGTAQLLATGDIVSLTVAVSGIPAGPHGFHLHTTGRCERPGFQSAGGHLNPTGEGHGLEDDDGSHLGDLPNLVAQSTGLTTKTVMLRGTRQMILTELFDQDGTAVMIHADPDDGTSEPSGNAGRRIACGVLKRS